MSYKAQIERRRGVERRHSTGEAAERLGGPQEVAEGRPLAKEIQRQGPELDPGPAAPGALYCPRNASAKVCRGVMIQGGNRVR